MRNEETRMTTGRERPFDLEERTARFGETVIVFCKRLPRDEVTRPLIGQLVRAATSVGANYCEADDADSKRDFHFKIGLCRREARESGHWLRMAVAAVPDAAEDARALWREAKELNAIFGAIRRRTTPTTEKPK